MALVVVAAGDSVAVEETPMAPAVSAPSAPGATASGSGGSLPLISALAWLVAMSVSLLALVRTVN